jgi:hypothetical protein
MKIIEVSRRRRQLYLLTIEGGDPIEVDVRTFDESPYRAGCDVTEEQLNTLLASSQHNRARERALYLLGLRDYACKELEQKLYTEASPETAAAVVERLRQVGLLDDQRYAARLARSLSEGKHYPRRRIEQELRRLTGLQVLALPLPHPVLGQCVALLWEGPAEAAAALHAACASLPRYHRPHAVYHATLPRTTSGKPARAEAVALLTRITRP